MGRALSCFCVVSLFALAVSGQRLPSCRRKCELFMLPLDTNRRPCPLVVEQEVEEASAEPEAQRDEELWTQQQASAFLAAFHTHGPDWDKVQCRRQAACKDTQWLTLNVCQPPT